MASNQFWYHIREGVRSIFTHGLMSFASVCMIIACLLIMGSFSLVAVNASHMLADLERDNEILAYVDDEFLDPESLQSRLEAIPNVSSAVFVSKAQALEDFKESHQENASVFEELPSNALRDRYQIHVDDIEQMETTVEQLKSVNGIARVQAALEVADGFVMVRNVASAIAVILIVMLVVISVFIIANTIRLATFTRRDEIAIVKMCGATNWFIRWPFIVEGVILGLVGGLLAFFVQWGIYGLLGRAMSKSGILSIIDTIPFGAMAGTVLLVFLLVSFVIGAGGSVLAIRKFLNV